MASLTGFAEVANVASQIIGRFFPDKTEQEKQQLAAALAVVQGQLDINREEAKSPSVFVAGWRPFIGWVGGVSLGMIYIPKAIVLTTIWAYQAYVLVSAWNGTGTPPSLPLYPDLGLTDLIGLLGSLLGFGILRSQDKKNGVAA
jgi:hypothetical protein